jgi:hypothetical protein
MNRDLKRTRSGRILFRRIVFAVIGAVVGVGALTLVVMLVYPPLFLLRLYVFLSPSNEFTHYLGKCMEIRRGQTMQEVRSAMAEFRISHQTPVALDFNTKAFSADFCSVHFSDEAVPRVTLVEFSPD